MIEKLLGLTWYNPIFMIVTITAIWFVPGIVVRRIAENRIKIKKAKKQEEMISRLYPKKQEEN